MPRVVALEAVIRKPDGTRVRVHLDPTKVGPLLCMALVKYAECSVLTDPPPCGMVRITGENPMPTTGAEAVRADAVSEAVIAWKHHLEARGRVDRYVSQSIKIVKDAAALRGWGSLEDITSREIDSYITNMDASGTTRNRHLGVISAFLGFCWRTERIQENPARRAPDPSASKPLFHS